MKREGLGTLTERVRFQSPTAATDGYGGEVHGWADEFDRWARFIYARGGEEVQAARLAGTSTGKVRDRSSSVARGISTAWRMIDLSRVTYDDGEPLTGVYNVREVDAITDRAWVYLVVQSGVQT